MVSQTTSLVLTRTICLSSIFVLARGQAQLGTLDSSITLNLVTIRSALNPNLCLRTEPYDDLSGIVRLASCTRSENQENGQFSFFEVPKGYQIRTRYFQTPNPTCLLTGFGTDGRSDGVPVITENGSPRSCQAANPWLTWTFVTLSGGESQLLHPATGKCIRAPAAQEGFYVVTAPCDSRDPGQRWSFESRLS